MSLGADTDNVRVSVHESRGHGSLAPDIGNNDIIDSDRKFLGSPVATDLPHLRTIDVDGCIAFEWIEHTSRLNSDLLFVIRSANVNCGSNVHLLVTELTNDVAVRVDDLAALGERE